MQTFVLVFNGIVTAVSPQAFLLDLQALASGSCSSPLGPKDLRAVDQGR
jgi:hypothetical protein